jgi:PAS domain S-box-containing protein
MNELQTLLGESRAIQEELQGSLHLHQAMFNNSFQFQGLLSPQGRLVEFNKTALDFINADRASLLGRFFWDTPWWEKNPDMQESLRKAVARVANGESVRFETVQHDLHGTEHVIDFTLKPIMGESGKVIFLIPEGRDITERKQAEQEICALNEELEARVVERTAQLEALNASLVGEIEQRKRAQEEILSLNKDLEKQKIALEDTNRELEAFSYSVSHDLRAPLRHIDGFSSMLLEECRDKLDAAETSYLMRIRKSCRRMGELIDDLLSLSRVSLGMVRIQNVSLSAMAREILEELQSSDPSRQVAVTVCDGMTVQGDSHLIRIALENLLSNAWKYTGKRDLAEITMGEAQVEGKPAYFIRDNGVGFDMAYVEKMFGVFQRLHSVEEFTGTGIGLAIVQRIIHRHGGRLWAEGEPDQGATFYFSFTS